MANDCFFSADFFDPTWFAVCVGIPPDAGPPWRMRPYNEGIQIREPAIAARIAVLEERREQREEIELTAALVEATLNNERAKVRAEIAVQRQEANRQLDRKQTALTNLAGARVKEQLGSLDAREIIRQKNLKAKRLANLKKAQQANRRRRRK